MKNEQNKLEIHFAIENDLGVDGEALFKTFDEACEAASDMILEGRTAVRVFSCKGSDVDDETGDEWHPVVKWKKGAQ